MSIHQQNSTLTKYYSVQYFFYKNKNILCAQSRYPFRSSYIRWLSEQRRVCKRRTKIWLRLCATWPTHLWQQIRSPLSLHLQSYLFLLFISFWKDPRVRIFSCIMNATWLPLGYLCPWKEPHTAMLLHATSRADTFISMSACIQLPHAAALFHFMETEGPEWKAPLFTPYRSVDYDDWKKRKKKRKVLLTYREAHLNKRKCGKSVEVHNRLWENRRPWWDRRVNWQTHFATFCNNDFCVIPIATP